MACGSAAFNDFLLKLGQQHEQFLRQAFDLSIEALKAENRRLTQELTALRLERNLTLKPAKIQDVSSGDEPPSTEAVARTEMAIWSFPHINVPEPFVVRGLPHLEDKQEHRHLGLQPMVLQPMRPDGTVPEPPPLPPGVVVEPVVSDNRRRPARVRPPPAIEQLRSESSDHSHHSRPSFQGRRSRRTVSGSYAKEAAAALFGWRGSGSGEKPKQHLFRLRSDIDERVKSRQARRMSLLFGSTDDVSAEHLYEVLQERTLHLNLSREAVAAAMAQLKAVPRRLPIASPFQVRDHSPDGFINIDALAQTISNPNLMSYIDEDEIEDVTRVVELLNLTTVTEAIEEATKLSVSNSAATSFRLTWESRLGVFVSCVTLFNVTSMGISVDHSPAHIGWFVFDMVCTFVFVTEVIMKMIKRGFLGYFKGEVGRWNMIDFGTTVVSAMESGLYGFIVIKHPTQQARSSTRLVLFLRVFRLVRLIKVMLVQSHGMMKDLAKMMVGFVIGLPSLMWVLLLFLFVLYCVGLTFRLCFGPSEGQDYIAICGLPDSIVDDFDSKDCPVHYMYGEEFFGTMSLAMFTTFRFMIGDYSTRGGNSLIVAFSYGYGMLFNAIFVSFMIVVIFGFFNIITAIFVDSTTTGLKNSDSKKKLSKQYERTYVKSKLKLLIARIQRICQEGLETNGETSPDKRPAKGPQEEKVTEHDFNLLPEDFLEVMRDPEVRALLEDLDVEIFNVDGLFDTFDPDGNGVVTVPNLVQAVMRLRGVPQKNDVIGAWVAVKSLTNRLDKFQFESLEGLRRLEMNQVKLEASLREARRSEVDDGDHGHGGLKALLGQVAAPPFKPVMPANAAAARR